MPPRFSYWTIIAGGLPTAFRAAEREELLPTFTRLKEKQPDAEMKWFARGKLWASPEEARASTDRNRSFDRARGGDRREADRTAGGDAQRQNRGRDWRPGGDHRDPRQQFKDAKKARNQRFKAEKFARKPRREEAPRERPHGDPLVPQRRPSHRDERQNRSTHRPADRFDRDRHAKPRSGGGKPFSPRSEWNAQPPRGKPHGDKLMRPTGPSASRDRDRDKPFRPRAENRSNARGEARSNDRPRGPGHGTYRGEGHGDNSWKPKPPRDERRNEAANRRPFAPRSFDRERARGSGSSEPPSQPPRRPAREPKPNENPEPSAPPRPSEPVIPPPGPPERGRFNRNKRRH